MNIAVCDDEEFFRNDTERRILEYAQVNHLNIHVDKFIDGLELLAADKVFDIVFIDFEMENSNGLDVARKIRAKNIETKIVFVSSHPDIVFEAIKYKTFRFLVKPVTDESFNESMAAAVKERKTDYIVVVKDDQNDKNVTILERDIIYVQADNIYSIIVTPDRTFKYMNNISALQSELKSDCFYRSNRSFLVNMNYIQSYDNKEILMSNGHKAVISKLKFKEFKNTYFDFIKSKNIG